MLVCGVYISEATCRLKTQKSICDLRCLKFSDLGRVESPFGIGMQWKPAPSLERIPKEWTKTRVDPHASGFCLSCKPSVLIVPSKFGGVVESNCTHSKLDLYQNHQKKNHPLL